MIVIVFEEKGGLRWKYFETELAAQWATFVLGSRVVRIFRAFYSDFDNESEAYLENVRCSVD